MTPRGDKQGREPLTREKILGKAIEILDAEGAAGLSMRRLGEALGVEAMALYHHFPSKDAMLDAIAARIIEETGPGLEMGSADWKTVMLSGPAAAGRALEAHPKAGWLFLGREYATGPSLQMLEAPLAILHSAGFRDQELVDAAHAIFALVAGWYILASGEGGTWSGPSEDALPTARETAPLTASLAPQLGDWGHGLEDGLMALLEGLEARHRTAG
jgi:AcrR family transcriptional regulator